MSTYRNTSGLILSLLVYSFCSAQQNYYVSLAGDDQWPGTLQQPFRSLEKAISKVAGTTHSKVDIHLREGSYSIAETIVITPAMLNGHSLRIASYKNESVVLTGAVKLDLQWTNYSSTVFQADVGKHLVFDQLYFNGTALPMARFPNYYSAARVFNGTSADAIRADRIKKWRDPSGGYLHALHEGEWGDFHYKILGKKADSLVMEGGWQNNRPAPMHKQHRFVENIFEELDAPGEWFYNADSGILYLYAPESSEIKTAVLERSAVNNIIELKGTETEPVQDVQIENILFTGTNRTFMLTREPLLRSDWTIYRGGAILVEGGKNINISGCTFSNLGGNAIFVSKYHRDVFIQHNYIHHIGASAIAFVGDTSAVRSAVHQYSDFIPLEKMDTVRGPKTNTYPADCVAYDNLIHNIGTIEKQVAGIQISMAMNIQARHNSIYNTPRAGINIGDGCWGGHVIANNDVFNTVLETGDHGAFNSWGRNRFWLPDIAEVDARVAQFPSMPLLDVIKPITITNNRFKCEHGWDIDLDDGSSNYKITNNVCLNGGLKLREGYFREVTNNIIINNTFHPHVWYAKSMDVFAHNIVSEEYAPIRVNVWGEKVDSNLFIQKHALMAARANGTDINSVHGDPMFVNEASGDFGVAKKSAAVKIGFRNFPMNEFGVVSARLKSLSAKPIIKTTRTLAPTKKGSMVEWLGATIKNVETVGEQSASGSLDMNGVLIVKVVSGSIAAKSKLQAGDIIRKVNGKPVNNVAEMLNAIQVINWQGEMTAEVLQNQQVKNLRILLK